MNTLNDDTMYQALLDKDSTFEGIFFAGIKTTGIFCRPTCTARKPKKENVEFFTTAKEAILKGYRACKICKPLNQPNETPQYIAALLEQIENHPEIKLKDADLIQQNIDPSTLRRWFLKNYNMTFHAYQRINRINHAFNKIQEGQSITNVAYDSGFDSLSGFGESFKNIFGVAPSHTKEQKIIYLTRLNTPLGTMFAGATDKGICLLEFTDRKMLETELKQLTKIFNAVIIQSKSPFFDILTEQLQAYFAGTLQTFTVPLDTKGTPFQEHVWATLQTIPYGTTCSYLEEATMMGKPKAVRAIGHANGMNRISIIIPCHRVIGANGDLTGYGGGLWRKRWLLELERSHNKNHH
ncbi:bifunctional transcriptional activator/DNA repair enzyme AdaA [Neisseria sp. Ec49-e6-T10]|uniref:bifunctional transcriptional activator/DNA repair enzyme AdaA n=1 Tax=Neisseria sp. Ec49-e6-T10 TaxID=3140744 RepID=UPI003EBF7BD2